MSTSSPGAQALRFAALPGVSIDQLELSADELLLYSLSLGEGIRVDEAAGRTGMAQEQVVAGLKSLQAKGAVMARLESVAPAPPPAAPQAPTSAAPRAPTPAPAAARPQAPAEEEVDLEPARRKQLEDMDQRLQHADHFAALGVPPGASPEVVKKAYYEASRHYHPDRFFGKKLGPYRARVDRIFRRLTEAHQVLTQPDRREAYLKENPHLRSAPPPAPAPQPSDPESEARRRERQQRLARHPYLSRTHRLSELVSKGRAAISRGEFEQAFKELSQASQLDPKNREVSTLLAEARRRHEQRRATQELERGRSKETQQDLPGAQAAYRMAYTLDPQSGEAAYLLARAGWKLSQPLPEVRVLAARAVELMPDKAAHHVLLAQVLLQLEQRKPAREHLQEALRLEPGNAEARALSKRLGFSLMDILKR